MKRAIFAILLLFIIGCAPKPVPAPSPTPISFDVQDLMLTNQDLRDLGLSGYCQTPEEYSNVVDSTLGQYMFCNYTADSLNSTEIIIELKKFTNHEALNGSYQYDSSHYFSIQGLLSENDYGDQSRFRMNNENDYGGQFNPPDKFFYHLWFTKGLYLVHITSGGSKDAKGYIEKMGHTILGKFDTQ